ncbi:MAG TPA: hypothetical protein VFC10_15965 [Terriglobia bacterium]|jgi:aspartate aminotransferase-like enzyme|nr:hypothetical protein [Terriglobia bacterium]
MNAAQIRRHQAIAIRKSRQKELGLAMRVAIAGDVGIWEIAAQLEALNETLRRQSVRDRRKGRKR